MSIQQLKVPIERLTSRCDPDDLGFETSEEVEPLDGTIGQERAISALELGLDIDEPGFNLFISGLPGTGRTTALRSFVERIALKKPVPPDWGYVFNFQDPSQPVALSLPCGMMRLLKIDMEELVESSRREIPGAFESEDYTQRMEEAMAGVQSRRQEMTSQMEEAAQEAGLALRQSSTGVSPVPIQDGVPMSPEDYGALPEQERESLRERAEELQGALNRSLGEMRRLGKEASAQAREVDKDIVRYILSPMVSELRAKYTEFPSVVSYLDEVEKDMVEQVDVFKPGEQSPTPVPGGSLQDEVFIRYCVNDLVDNTVCIGAPVIFEYSPTYYNLFGRVDYQARVGTLTTNLTMIKSGAIHMANGGYLIVQARDLLTSPYSWETLKRMLRSKEIGIENMGEQYSPLPSATLRPQPIPVNAKVIMVGTPDVLHILQSTDEDFRRYFKVSADFDTLMDRTPENMEKYAQFVAARCRDGNFRPFHKTAVARVVDYSSRLVEDQRKLTTQFMNVSDVITEANYWAGVEDRDVVMGEHVKKAIDQRRYRASLTEDRLRELIEDGTNHIGTEGRVVGQVNGLAVLAVGDYSFGKPSRITARVSLGRGQVINVERETQMSGKIHDKGFMILTGYLRGKHGYNKPLSLNASIGFEQTYSEMTATARPQPSSTLYPKSTEGMTMQQRNGR